MASQASMRTANVVFAMLATAVMLLSVSHCQMQGGGMDGGDPTDIYDCDVAVVGGGPAGVYTAFRLLETNTSSSVCLFEATSRLGGRIYSVHNLGPNRDLTVDMGAYRYMPLTQPLITDLIQNFLQLPNRLYQPAVPDYKVILTPDGSNAGFATWVTTLAGIAVDMGLELNYNSQIVKLYSQNDGSFTLQTSSGRNITANSVVLNLPSRPLHRLLQNSGLPKAGTQPNQQLLDFYQIRATKLYLFYNNAWWLANGMNNGSLAYNLPWNTTQPPKVPIIGRYHDGQAKCQVMGANGSVMASSVGRPMYKDYYYTAANSLNTQQCYGWIQATYTSDGGTTNISHYPLDYLVDYASPTFGPDGNALPYSLWDNTTMMGAKLLNDSHTQLMAYQATVNKSLSGNALTTLPTQAIVALWDPSITWSGGAWHSNKTVEAGDSGDVSAAIIKPFSGYNLYVADEAYGTQLGWAEGGLVMAENIVRDYFGATTPTWMSSATASAVAYGPSFSDLENVQQGGGTGQPQVLSPSSLTQGNFAANAGLAPTPSNY